jgi:hypothetical protein
MPSRTTIVALCGLLLPCTGLSAVALAAMFAPPAPRAKTASRPAVVQHVPAAKPIAEPVARPEPYTVRRILDVPGVLRIGDHYWDETGAPAGQVVITVDLQAKVLSIFRGGYEIGTAAVLYGGDDKPTPLGVFPITEKDADHRSSLYAGAPMPYMMRLTNDGISIHGSPGMEPGLMTHGCVGVPVAFAKKLFRAAGLGTKVIVTNGERLDLGQPITAA